MKRVTQIFTALTVSMFVLTSCDQNLNEDLAANEAFTELSSEEITSAIETMSISYDIQVLQEDDTEVTISNDEELDSYGKRQNRPRIVYPIEVTVDGETITVNSKAEMKALIGKKKKGHRKPPFELVFPVTVSTESGDQVMEDKEAFKAYRESLEEGTRPEFVFPISVIMNEETIVINSEEELEALKPERKPKHPELVFPVTVVTEDGNLEIADQDAFKAYKETLEEGTRPEFVYPISIIVNDETIVINSEEELKDAKPNHGPKKPELVFPVTVVTEDGNLEIADADAMKAYKDTLEEGTRPEFVFPITVLIDEDEFIVNDADELKALFPKKRRKK